MVTRETSYIGQLYFGLSSDDPADIAEWHNGDRILLMDQDQMYIYDEAAVTFHEIPMGGGGGGGGGGGSPVLLASGTYTQTTAASGVNIPASFDGTIFSYFVCANISGEAHMHAWYRNYGNLDWVEPDIPQLITANYRDANDVNHLVGAMNNNNGITYYLEPNIHINQFSNSYPIKAGEYTWKIWGYPS